jgi:hypothetical protein
MTLGRGVALNQIPGMRFCTNMGPKVLGKQKKSSIRVDQWSTNLPREKGAYAILCHTPDHDPNFCAQFTNSQ